MIPKSVKRTTPVFLLVLTLIALMVGYSFGKEIWNYLEFCTLNAEYERESKEEYVRAKEFVCDWLDNSLNYTSTENRELQRKGFANSAIHKQFAETFWNPLSSHSKCEVIGRVSRHSCKSEKLNGIIYVKVSCTLIALQANQPYQPISIEIGVAKKYQNNKIVSFKFLDGTTNSQIEKFLTVSAKSDKPSLSSNVISSYKKALSIEWDEFNREGALIEFDKVIERAPKFALAYYSRGMAQPTTKQVTADYSKAIEVNPAFVSAYLDRASFKAYAENDKEAALNDCNRVISISPTEKMAYLLRGRLLSELNRFQEAISDFNCFIKLFPNCRNAYLNRAEAKMYSGDVLGAVFDGFQILLFELKNRTEEALIF